ncbi:unnamed protein product [Psylliodes chrysocephalus]|uniref:Uncharacterized protein n=1 Tax=Psylliodes chrysocephalus TaxID=3402493 RepID=A0A9P0D413_9CUCU|nr:unnamed protein product [Psylliodes chrysocephala]
MSSQSATTQDVYNLLKNIESNLGKKIDDVQDEIRCLKKSVDYEIKDLKEKANSLEDENRLLKAKIKYIERKLKNNNIFIYGLLEQTGETQPKLLKEVLHLINTTITVELTPLEINNIYRVGKNKEHNQEDKEDIKILVETLRMARTHQKKAVIKGNGIIIEETYYLTKDILDEKHFQKSDQEFSPPPKRNIASNPGTPSLNVFDNDSDIDLNVQQPEILETKP